MKKLTAITVVIVMLFALITACGGGSQPSPTPTPAPAPAPAPEPAQAPDETQTDAPEDEYLPEDEALEVRPPQDFIEGSDILPARWQGEWIVVHAERYFDVGDTIDIIGYDNEFLYTDSSGRENKRWFSYVEEDNMFHIHNEPPPFGDDSTIRESFELRRESTNELVFMRYEIGQEVRFERVNKTEPDSVLWTAPLIGSDLLPESWHGEWVAVLAERYFDVGETIFFKDFDNAAIYINSSGWENNRWFLYEEDEQIIRIYNEPPPFEEDMWRESFHIRSVSDNEISLRRVGVAQDVKLERVS